MSEPTLDKMDRLLRDWAARQRPGEASPEAIKDQVLQAAAESVGTTSIPSTKRRWSARLVWVGVGVAASLLAAAILIRAWSAGGREEGLRADNRDPLPGAASDTPELALKAALFSEMAGIFEGNLAWLAETDGKVILGVESQPRRTEMDAEPITIRVVAMVRKPGQTAWEQRWSVDCIVRNEELAEFSPPDTGGDELAIWAHVLPDGVIAVDSSLRWENNGGQTMSQSTIHQSRAPQVFEFRTDQAEYQVFQTAARLPKEVG